MFEGVVSQVLAGYLGRYIKCIQKEQLKIGIWNGEILLEKVELILEAFDYLQLPFTLKNGLVGKWSIRIPWKKLGWDPIIVVLEDVFVCACQREWSSESIRKGNWLEKWPNLMQWNLQSSPKVYLMIKLVHHLFLTFLQRFLTTSKFQFEMFI